MNLNKRDDKRVNISRKIVHVYTPLWLYLILQAIDEELSADFLELCARVEKVLPRHASFAPWHYFAKAAFIWGTFIAIEMYMHYTANYRYAIFSVALFIKYFGGQGGGPLGFNILALT